MKNLKYLLLLPLFLVLTACDQDPYPVEGDLRTVQRSEPQKPLPALAISIDDKIEYREGRYREYKVRVAVEEPGEPIVKVDNLPEGAEFDPKTFIIKWRPDFYAGNDPNDPGIKSRIYPITIWLRSTVLPKEQFRKTVNLVVFDVPQEIDVTPGRRNPSVNENETFSETITISNADYPQGPFKLLTKGLPANLEVEEVSPTQFRLKFKPDFFHVNRTVQTRGELKYEGKLIVSNPANHIVEKEYSITVNDVRRKVSLVAPENMEQGLDASFQIAAYDLNREIAPTIRLTSDVPGFGTFKTEIIKNPKSFASVLNVFWKDIPPAYNNTKQKISYEACVLNSRNSTTNCEKKTTTIKLVVRDRKAPLISRNSWPAGELIYLGFNERLTRSLRITDQEDTSLTPKVEVFPEEMRKYVTWSNGTIAMRFNKEGVFQFNVRATSDYNMSSSESFIVEVFPESRKRTLLFADSTRDPEVMFYRDTFKGTMDIMNPAIQVVNQRNISDRDTLVITTSTLLDPSVKSEVLSAIKTIKNVVIASPLIEELPEEFQTELAEKYDLKPIGRYQSLPNLPPLSKMSFETTKQFQKPKDAVRLKGTTTSESANPMIFNVGLDDPDKICKGVLGLNEDGLNPPLVVGLSCARFGGGKIVILGTEWADFLTSETDKNIPVKWFDTLIKQNF